MSKKEKEKNSPLPTCGIIMPISEIENCSEEHWTELLDIYKSVAEGAGFKAELVSRSSEVDIIHKRIVQNVYLSDIILCDVSCKNPNVMFELGLRIAFDKIVVIVKDDVTDYLFDTSPIEHLEYPRSLRHGKIEKFKEDLQDKLTSTYKHNKEKGENTSPYMESFGAMKLASIPQKEVEQTEFILTKLDELQKSVSNLSGRATRTISQFKTSNSGSLFQSDKVFSAIKIMDDLWPVFLARMNLVPSMITRSQVKANDFFDFVQSYPKTIDLSIDGNTLHNLVIDFINGKLPPSRHFH